MRKMAEMQRSAKRVNNLVAVSVYNAKLARSFEPNKKTMSLELSGKVVKLMPVQRGESQRGAWQKQDMIIETVEQYPKQVAITCWGEKVDEIQKLQPGTQIKVGINIESREYNERWYTDVRAWKIDVETAGGSGLNAAMDPPEAPVINMDETEGDLPF